MIKNEKIAIIGIGRLGKSLARALCEVGCDVVALSDLDKNKAIGCAKKCGDSTKYYQIEQIPRTVTMVILTVGDDSISLLAKTISRLNIVGPSTVVFHTSGVASAAAMNDLKNRTNRLASVHPVQTFSGAEDDWKRLYNIYYSMEGDKLALVRIKSVIAQLKGKTFLINASDKSLYHLACVFASNYFISVISVATQIFGKLDISEQKAIQILEPLIIASADNVSKKGVASSATGPVTRGDVGTLVNHLQNLQNSVPEFMVVYIELGKVLIDQVQKSTTLSKNQIDQMKETFAAFKN